MLNIMLINCFCNTPLQRTLFFHGGVLRLYINSIPTLFFLGGIEKLIMMDTSSDMVKMCEQAEKSSPNKDVETSFLVGDEEFLPMKERYAKYGKTSFFL